MNNSTVNSGEVPKLDSDTASQLLSNVFAECNIMPNSIPLETLESWGNYKKTEFRIGRIISYTVLVLLVLLPLLFFRPTIIAQRTNVDSTNNAVYRIEIKTLLPVDGVIATLNGTPLELQRENSRTYLVSAAENGTMQIKATSLNGQYTVKDYDVTYIDMDKPLLTKSYTQDGQVYLIVRDTYSGIDYDNVSALDDGQNTIKPVSFDKKTETIVFSIPSVNMVVTIPDNSGNELQILISPTK